MREVFAELRTSPYIIGLLYDLATTPKHERFIRNIFLNSMPEGMKRKIIDYSTSISSIRLQKNYRTLDEVWKIFNTCCEHYYSERLYINSELYSNMIRKLRYLCKTDELFKQQQDKLYAIIKRDSNRIISDEYFLSSLYRFLPEKQITDSEGNICSDFIKEMKRSKISIIIPLNNIMSDLKSKGFDVVWNFYEFIVKYYQENGKRKTLRPDVRTITYLMEAVTTNEQFEKVDHASKLWGLETELQNNKIYRDVYVSKRKTLGYNIENINKRKDEIPVEKSMFQQPITRDYKQRANNIIELVKKDVYMYGCITPTQFNQYLKKFGDIMDDINRDQYLTRDIAKKLKTITYKNVRENLIDKYIDYLSFNALSYVYLIKITPSIEVKRWIDKLNEKKDIYKYDMVACAAIAQSPEVCNADIDVALDYFEFWEDIVHDIGYDPADPESFSETTEITKYKCIDDYDGYWLIRCTHCIREMTYYWNCLKQPCGFVDKETLRFVKQQMEFFEQYNVPFPKLIIQGQVIDFKDELNKYHNILK